MTRSKFLSMLDAMVNIVVENATRLSAITNADVEHALSGTKGKLLFADQLSPDGEENPVVTAVLWLAKKGANPPIHLEDLALIEAAWEYVKNKQVEKETAQDVAAIIAEAGSYRNA